MKAGIGVSVWLSLPAALHHPFYEWSEKEVLHIKFCRTGYMNKGHICSLLLIRHLVSNQYTLGVSHLWAALHLFGKSWSAQFGTVITLHLSWSLSWDNHLHWRWSSVMWLCGGSCSYQNPSSNGNHWGGCRNYSPGGVWLNPNFGYWEFIWFICNYTVRSPHSYD